MKCSKNAGRPYFIYIIWFTAKGKKEEKYGQLATATEEKVTSPMWETTNKTQSSQ